MQRISVLRYCLLFVSVAHFSQNLYAAPFCDSAHAMNKPTNEIDTIRSSTAKNEFAPAIAFSPEQQAILAQVQKWRTEIEKAKALGYDKDHDDGVESNYNPQFMNGFARAAYISGEISNFAASLISMHRNSDFRFLASQIEFPLNKRVYEDYQNFFHYGTCLLETAIESKNYEIFQELKDIPREYRWTSIQVPMISRWTQTLTEKVSNDPVFVKDALAIPKYAGPDYSPVMARYGLVTSRTLERFQDIQINSETSLRELYKILAEILPSGEMHVEALHREIKSPAQLKYLHSGLDEKIVDPLFQVQIFDSTEFRKGWFGGGHYKKALKFNLQTSVYKSDNPNGYTGRHHWIKPGEINWIRSLEVGSNFVRVLVERDQSGIFYDRGTKFQEMTLLFDAPSGRIQKVILKNGDSLYAKNFWAQQQVLLGRQLNCFSGVCFAGEEYLQVNEIDHRGKE